jgi:hypothetical protein
MKTKLISGALLLTLALSLSAAPIAYEEISLLVRMRETDSFIAQQLAQRRLLHALTPQQEAVLKAQGVSEALIQALRNPTARLSDAEVIAFESKREQQKQAALAASTAEAAAAEARREQQLKAMQEAEAAGVAAIARTTAPLIRSESDAQPIQGLAEGHPRDPMRPRVGRVPFLPPPGTPNVTHEHSPSFGRNTTIVGSDFLGGARVTDNFGNSTRIQPDFLGGFRTTDSNGNVTRYLSDFLGGYRGTDNCGNTTRLRSDFLGGFRASDFNGNVTRYRPDYLGGFRGVDVSGNTTRITPDNLGGYRVNH